MATSMIHFGVAYAMATIAGMQCNSTMNSLRASQASLACVKPSRLGHLRGTNMVRLRRRGPEGALCLALEKKDNLQLPGKKQGVEEDDGNQRGDPLGFLKEKNLKTKAFQTFTRESNEKCIVSAKPLRLGKRVQVWDVHFTKAVKSKELGSEHKFATTAVARLTLLVGLLDAEKSKEGNNKLIAIAKSNGGELPPDQITVIVSKL